MESFKTASVDSLTLEDVASGRDLVLEQIAWTRQYTLQLINSVPRELWYEQPAGAETHLAWQVGHLAVSQYGLMLFRQRGRSPGDLELMPGWLRKKFGRGSTPAKSAEGMPTADELLSRLEQIHSQSMVEARNLPAETLLEPIDMPFAAYPIKLGALLFMPVHESLHAGQIGLLRRLHSLAPIR